MKKFLNVTILHFQTFLGPVKKNATPDLQLGIKLATQQIELVWLTFHLGKVAIKGARETGSLLSPHSPSRFSVHNCKQHVAFPQVNLEQCSAN